VSSELERQLEQELDRLGDLIDGVADTGSVKSMRAAMTAASQLARLRERMIDRREVEEPAETTPREASQQQRLEALRSLVQRYAHLYCPRCGTQAR
jgi:hypothetical protein